MSTGLYSITTRAAGTILTATIYNADQQNHVTNQNPSMTGAYSDNVAQMQTQTDPGSAGSESLAPSLAGELERIRYQIAKLRGGTYWYGAASATRQLIQKSGAQITNSGAAATEILAATIPVAAGRMGANGVVYIDVSGFHTNNANSKFINIRIGASGAGLGGTLLASLSLSNVSVSYIRARIFNRNNTASQRSDLEYSAAAPFGASNTLGATAAINTNSAWEIVLSTYRNSIGDTLGIDGYSVEILSDGT